MFTCTENEEKIYSLAGSWFIKVDEFDVDKQYLICWGDLLSYNLLQAIPKQITYNQPRFISTKIPCASLYGAL